MPAPRPGMPPRRAWEHGTAKKPTENGFVLYALLAFAFWLLLIVFMALGTHRLLEQFGKGRYVDWLLLPGVLVAEMAYVFGCLITGAEVRSASLFPTGTGRAAMTQTTPRIKVAGPIMAALIAMAGCVATIVVLHGLLGEPIIRDFIADESGLIPKVGPDLSGQLPTTAEEFWAFPGRQVQLVRKMYETCLAANWLNWRVPLFVYLGLCLSIRLGPARRPVRPTLGAAVLGAIVLAVVQQASAAWADRINGLWLLLTYIWASLLLVLLLVALLRGCVYLVTVIREESQT